MAEIISDRKASYGSIEKLLRATRHREGITQEQVGGAIGMTGNGFGKIERGGNGLDVSMIRPLCDALRLPPTELLSVFGPLFSPPSDDEDFRELEVRFEKGDKSERSSKLGALTDAGYGVTFSRQELAMQKILCEFFGLGDPLSEDAVRTTGGLFRKRRQEYAKSKLREERENMNVREAIYGLLLGKTDEIAETLMISAPEKDGKAGLLAAIIANIIVDSKTKATLPDPGIEATEIIRADIEGGGQMTESEREAMADKALKARRYWNGYDEAERKDILISMLCDYKDEEDA